MQRFALLAVPLLSLAPIGCSASVAGEVDGKAVDTLFSALFTEDKDDVGEDELTTVAGGALSVLDGCNGSAKRQTNLNELQDTLNKDLEDAEGDEDKIKDALDAFATGVVEYDEANIPTDFWSVNVSASSIDDGEIDGASTSLKFDEAPDEDVVGGLVVCRINDHPSVGEDDNDLPIVETDADCWLPIEADIEIVKWEEEATFNVTATATLGDFENFDPLEDEEPDEVGEVEITISSSHCKPLQDAQEEAEEIAEDALPG